MAQNVSPHSEMVRARQSDGISVIFDERSPASTSRSRSRSSSCSSSRFSFRSRGRAAHRGRYRSPSSSSSSSSSSRSTSRSSRSRSHPRCHRRSSRCRCRDHRRYQKRGSPPRQYRAHSRSYSRSPSADRYYNRRRYRSRSRSSGYRSRYSTSRVVRYRRQFSRSPPRSFRGRSRSRSSDRSVVLSVEEKRQLLEAARENAMKNLGVQRLELPESVKPILTEQSAQSEPCFSGAASRVRPDSEHASQSSRVEDAQSPRLSPKTSISFSINNLVAKPTVSAQPCTKVTSLVDSVESKKPYGHWIPVKSARH